MAERRDFSEPVGLNWTQDGTDVDFGSLSRQLIGFGAKQGMSTLFGHDVTDLDQGSDGRWTVKVVNRRTGQKRKFNAGFVFVAPAAVPCRCCRRRVSRRPRVSAASRSAVSGCAAATPN